MEEKNIECIEFVKADKDGVLVGRATLRVKRWGVILREVALFDKNGKQWVGLPSRGVGEGANKRWVPYIEFESKVHSESFSKAAAEAIKEFAQKHVESETRFDENFDLPF